MNLFIFNKSLRCHDNTTLIHMAKMNLPIVPIFIFTEQVDRKVNEYFSDNSVEFMVESLKELARDIADQKGKMYFFHHNDIITVLQSIHTQNKIASLGTNYDYSPYARQRQDNFTKFCKDHNITFYIKEDHVLFNILEGKNNKADGTPYTVFTPFKNFVLRTQEVREPEKYNKFNFKIIKALESNKYHIEEKHIDKFFVHNPNALIQGGRSHGLRILANMEDFKDYGEQRDYFLYKTTYLASHNHFGTVSIREVFHAMKNKLKRKSAGIINELIWRDFYYNLYYNFPHMLGKMIGGQNKAFKEKYNHINWNNNEALFQKWATGTTGIPICDAGMRQLNKEGFMPNRLRMITAGVLTKLFLITWRKGEQHFAQKLKDYDSIQNSAGWGWTVTGIDPQQVFRIFSPKLQGKKFDPKCEYVLKYVPELAGVPIKDIHDWENKYKTHLANGVKYYPPAIEYKMAYRRAINELVRVHKLTSIT